jgi:DNA-directed RNA polymerase beta' subunit
VADIKKVFIRETERLVPDAAAQGGYAKESEWMLDTEGVNLLEVLCHPDVDATRTISNHLVEVIDVLGIEAGRGALLKEVRGVIEFDGASFFFELFRSFFPLACFPACFLGFGASSTFRPSAASAISSSSASRFVRS